MGKVATTLGEQSFARAVAGTPAGKLRAIENAYRAADLVPPTRIDGILGALDAEPSVREVAGQLAGEALTAADPEAFLELAAQRVARAQAVAEVRGSLRVAVSDYVEAHLADWGREAAKAVTKAFNQTAAKLATHAARLPDTGDPLNLADAYESDTTADVRAAKDLLSKLGVLAGCHQVGANVAPAGNRDLPFVVAVAEGKHAAAAAGTLARFSLEAGVDAALLRVAAGRQLGLSLALPAGWEELYERSVFWRDAAQPLTGEQFHRRFGTVA